MFEKDISLARISMEMKKYSPSIDELEEMIPKITQQNNIDKTRKDLEMLIDWMDEL